MATVPTLVTYVTGQVVTAAQLNGNPGNTWGDFVLSPPDCQVRQTVIQSLPNNTWTDVLFDTEDLDPDLWHSTSTNTARITPQTAGIVRLAGGVGFAGSATGRRGTRWVLNGSGTAISGSSVIVLSSAAVAMDVPARTLKVTVNGTTDFLTLQAFQDTGGALNTGVVAETQSTITADWARTP